MISSYGNTAESVIVIEKMTEHKFADCSPVIVQLAKRKFAEELLSIVDIVQLLKNPNIDISHSRFFEKISWFISNKNEGWSEIKFEDLKQHPEIAYILMFRCQRDEILIPCYIQVLNELKNIAEQVIALKPFDESPTTASGEPLTQYENYASREGYWFTNRMPIPNPSPWERQAEVVELLKSLEIFSRIITFKLNQETPLYKKYIQALPLQINCEHYRGYAEERLPIGVNTAEEFVITAPKDMKEFGWTEALRYYIEKHNFLPSKAFFRQMNQLSLEMKANLKQINHSIESLRQQLESQQTPRMKSIGG